MTSAMEDYAETFALWVRRHGRLPEAATPAAEEVAVHGGAAEVDEAGEKPKARSRRRARRRVLPDGCPLQPCCRFSLEPGAGTSFVFSMRRLLVPVLLPYVTRWIEAREQQILIEGAPLSEQGIADALAVGVVQPQRVRLLRVPKVPLPAGRLIRLAERLGGGPWERTAGLTARYGIFIREAYWGDRRLIAHELAHTAQYERLGGIAPFLRVYLTECLTSGYAGAALELEAVAAASTMAA
ncbi:MAG: hypothetical protein QOE70_2865 [Chthoniobacter sp.]|jgi:hypothetical protein|nr:hypothetical protein [Chthoniobacter sp.]